MEKTIKKNIAILGSTGSIGTQTLDIIRQNPDKYKATVLTANHRWEDLARQAIEFKPSLIVIGNEEYLPRLREALSGLNIEIRGGRKEIENAPCAEDVDLVVTAMVGYSGLLPTINAIKARKTIALANKETLVVAGEIITRLLKVHDTSIIPVDSEHSAIFQCLQGESHDFMRRIILTASGGPFRKLSKEELSKVTREDALKHPNWHMGPKVTIDSASMMNKGFEMIEAKWLFDCNPEHIKILIHPQSIVHSMVEFCDGSIKAQLGVPDMRIPIQYALSYPERIHTDRYLLDWRKAGELTFEEPDFDRYPMLRYAFEAIKTGGNAPCILNAANEVAVKAFLDGRIRFIEIPELVGDVLSEMPASQSDSIEKLMETHREATKKSEEWINTH